MKTTILTILVSTFILSNSAFAYWKVRNSWGFTDGSVANVFDSHGAAVSFGIVSGSCPIGNVCTFQTDVPPGDSRCGKVVGEGQDFAPIVCEH